MGCRHRRRAADAASPSKSNRPLFRKLPIHFAATLVPAFPYYHAYLLLHSRPPDEMKAIVDSMHPGERMQFFDELPEETWHNLDGRAGRHRNRAVTRLSCPNPSRPPPRRSRRSSKPARLKKVSSAPAAARCR